MATKTKRPAKKEVVEVRRYGRFTYDQHGIGMEGDFPTTRAEALEDSITKWEGLAMFAREDGILPHADADTCALCDLYLENQCAGCPVAEATRQTGCLGTPYIQYVRGRENPALAARMAEAEKNFLISLRPLVEYMDKDDDLDNSENNLREQIDFALAQLDGEAERLRQIAGYIEDAQRALADEE